ncbi:hypothetical protein B0H11DRAFT_2432843 [Mycena galericulata]|nr:hypothetical protein B0H11DRAFT_2432843 [Mycena galericulata]
MLSPRLSYLSGIAFLSLATLFSMLATISVPTLHGVDFVRINTGIPADQGPTQISVCFPPLASCSGYVPGYSFSFAADLEITPAWTHALAIHPFVLSVTAIALILTCLKHEKGPILAFFASAVAAFFTLLAFIIDIAFFANANNIVGQFNSSNAESFTATPGAGFWLTFVSLLLILAPREPRCGPDDVLSDGLEARVLGPLSVTVNDNNRLKTAGYAHDRTIYMFILYIITFDKFLLLLAQSWVDKTD